MQVFNVHILNKNFLINAQRVVLIRVDQLPLQVDVLVYHINPEVFHFKVIEDHEVTHENCLVVLFVVSRRANLTFLYLRQ